MSIDWAPDMIGWACAQLFPTLAMPLGYASCYGTYVLIPCLISIFANTILIFIYIFFQ